MTVPAGDDATLDAFRALRARDGGAGPADSRAVRNRGAHDRRNEQADMDRAGRHDTDDSDLKRARDFLFAATAPPPGAAGRSSSPSRHPAEGREAVEIARRIFKEAPVGTPIDEMAVLLLAWQGREILSLESPFEGLAMLW